VQGSAKEVVVGNGANKQLPVESIAGKRRFAQPLDETSKIPSTHNHADVARDCSRAFGRGSSVIAIRYIVPSVD